MRLFVGLGNPGAKYAHNRHNIGFMAVDEIARRHGFAPWRRRFQGETAEGTLDRRAGGPASSRDLHERVRDARCRKRRASSSSRPARSPCFRTNSNCRRPRCGSKSAAALPAITACVRSPRISATTIAACGSGSATPASRNWCTATCCPISPRTSGPGSGVVRGGCRQRRAARHGSRFDVPEQGASGDAGQGIFRQGR